jgi:hypothetical protein
MNPRAEHGVYLALAVVVGAFFVVFAFMGPIGWVLDVLLVLAVIKLADWSGFFGGASVQEKRNCPKCGARNPIDRPACGYCAEPMPESR